MKAHVILEFDELQDYQQTMWTIHDLIPLLRDWEEVAIYCSDEEAKEDD